MGALEENIEQCNKDIDEKEKTISDLNGLVDRNQNIFQENESLEKE